MTPIQKSSHWRDMLQRMNAHRTEMLDGWQIIPVDRFPPLKQLDSMTYLGSFAWTQPHAKVKFLNRNHLHDIGAGWVTPTDIARDYLHCKFEGKRQRCTTRQYNKLVRVRKHQPLYAEPIFDMKASYLDLKSAYWQLLMLGGWDVEYSPDAYLSVRSDVFDFPCPHIKLARNSLVSMALPSSGTIWMPETGFKSIRPQAKTVNLVLWGFVMDALHAIASEMIDRAGAVYVNTDGYIIPDYLVNEAFKIADEWGVTLTIRHQGLATVRGAGDYDIGNRWSGRRRDVPYPHKYINPPKISWFKRKFQFFSDRIDIDYNPLVEDSLEFTES